MLQSADFHVGGLLDRDSMNAICDDWAEGEAELWLHNAAAPEVSANPTGNSGERVALKSSLKLRQGAGLHADPLLNVGCPSRGITLGKASPFDWKQFL